MFLLKKRGREENIKGTGKRGLLVRWERKGVNNTVKKRGHGADERENIKGAGIRGLLVRWEGKGVNNTVRILYINRLKA